jgi:hypothetical protein
MSCLNCGKAISLNYCAHCGQKTGVGKFTVHGLMHDIPHAIFHLDRGLIPTMKALLIKPQQVINEYLDGKRMKYFNPLTMLALIAGAYALIYSFEAVWALVAKPWSAAFDEQSKKTMLFASRWYSLLLALMVPATALGNWIMFRKANRTIAEHLIVVCFLTAATTLILIIPTIPLAFTLDTVFGKSVPWIGMATWATGMLLSVTYNTYGLAKVFSSHYSTWSGVNRASIAFLISMVSGGLIGYLLATASLAVVKFLA